MAANAVVNQGASGPVAIYKQRKAIDFGSIPAPYVKEVTVALAEADAGDGVSVSAAQALAAGVFIGGARVTTTGVIGVTIGTSGGTTVTPNTVTLEVFLTKGETS